MSVPAHTASRIVAVLGPTNTGKTHFAIERMLAHGTGVIGLPLRLLAREIYDRVVVAKGKDAAALITGEERILPKDARYRICTVEAMPENPDADFLCVDEIQLAADAERGHVFTQRLLHARGRFETMFLGSEIMRGPVQALLPRVHIETRPRFSDLSFAGPKKLSRLPRRSAIVAFSAEEVYALAELVRRQRGGAAVVMGALSPRTRNAQVALYQSGEVDFLVATDAIGMGLNMDIDHVAFASLRKFDGLSHRPLRAHEIAQVAGRAGRHMRDGTFGTTGDAGGLDPEIVERVENHQFDSVRVLQWRNCDLDFRSLDALIRSLERPAPGPGLARAREAEDLLALKALARDEDVRAKTASRSHLRLLWEVCQVPDFVRTLAEEHARLLSRIFEHLSSAEGVIPTDWIAESLAKLDDVEGEIDTLAHRLSHVRIWTFISHRAHWLKGADHWQARARAVEDRLSDALHARLTQRFVDRRTSVLMRRLRQREDLEAAVNADGEVLVEGEFVGRLSGFHFLADPRADTAGQVHSRALKAAAFPAMRRAIAEKARTIAAGGDDEIDLSGHGRILHAGAPIAKLAKGATTLHPRIEILADDLLDAQDRIKLEAHLQHWVEKKIRRHLGALLALEEGHGLTGLGRGVAYRMVETLGLLPRSDETIVEALRALSPEARTAMRKIGVVFGESVVFVPALLKPAATRLRLLLWAIAKGLAEPPASPAPGLVAIDVDPDLPLGYYLVAGYRPMGTRAIRVDMLERLSRMVRSLDDVGPFVANAEMMALIGSSADILSEVLSSLGFRAMPRKDEQGTEIITWRRTPETRRRQRRQTAPPAPPIEDSPFAALAALRIKT